MRFDKDDISLVVAFLFGMAVMFAQPLQGVLSVAEAASKTYPIDVVPGLTIFVSVCALHYWRKCRHGVAALQRAARETEDARSTAASMHELIAMANALANVVDFSSLQREANRHVARLLRNRPVWVGVVAPQGWQWLIEPSSRSAEAIAAVAPRWLDVIDGGECRHQEWIVFALRSAGQALGLFGVSAVEPLTSVDRHRIETLIAVIGGSVKNVQLFEEMQVSSITDALTGCFNRAYAFTALDAELRRGRRDISPLAAIMLDIDGFKVVNDAHGHLGGDRILAAVGDLLRRILRTSDVTCRYGGDEFFVILPETPLEAAEHIAAQLRRAIEGLEVSGPTHPLSCRISLGVATAEPGEMDPAALVQRADEALYRDKTRSRGLCAVASTHRCATRPRRSRTTPSPWRLPSAAPSRHSND